MWNYEDRRIVATADDYSNVMCYNNMDTTTNIDFSSLSDKINDADIALKALTRRLDNLERKPTAALKYKNEFKTLNYEYRFRF